MGLIEWFKKTITGDQEQVQDALVPVRASTTHTAPMSIETLTELIGSTSQSASGVSVTPAAAMRQATVYSCIWLMSETVSQLPLHLYERIGDSRERATTNPLYTLLRSTPNGFHTASEFWQFIVACVLLRGMAAAYKVMVGSRLRELIPISPDSINEIWRGTRRSYNVILPDGLSQELGPENFLIVKGLTLNGQDAISPIKYMANSIGLAISTNDYSSKFYKNGARPSGALETDAALDPEKVKALREAWSLQHGGSNVGGTAVLTAGLKFKPMSMSNEDAQLLELLNFSRGEIAGIYGVPPHMIGAIEKTSSWGTGLAEQSLSFIKYTIAPWLNRIEQSISRDLLTPAEQKRFYPEFLTEQFLRGDTKNRYEAYKVALGGTQNPGFMTQNEIRHLENLPPVEGGDKLYQPEPSAGRKEEGGSDEEQAPTESDPPTTR